MFRQVCNLSFIAIAVLAFGFNANAQNNLTAKVGGIKPQPVVESDRVRDGLIGPVRRVRTEMVRLTTQDGRVVEGKRTLLEIVAYDIRGNKIENQYFPVAGATLTGKEVYKYDEKGNISEMTLVNGDGTLISKENYKYEFDFAGNWNKMTTSVAVVDAGKISFEPTEVTYRSIMYYLDENMVKMVQPGAPTNVTPTPPPPANTTAAAKKTEGGPVSRRGSKSSATLSPSLPNAVDRVNDVEAAEAADKPLTSEQMSRVIMDAEPPSPGPKPILKPVSGGVLNGTAIALPAPTYPDPAKRMRLSGVVSVSVIVDETGKVISAQATNGPTPLRDAAVQAALRARFSPTKLSGQPVKVSGLINYKFTLSN
jgi:protein TonB